MKNKDQNVTNVTGNVFNGVVWDGKTIDAIDKVAEALLNLTRVFASQNIEIDSLLRVGSVKQVGKEDSDA